MALARGYAVARHRLAQEKILWKRGEIATLEQFLLFSVTFCSLLLDFHVKTGTRISLRGKIYSR